jgi:hypothetical protein
LLKSSAESSPSHRTVMPLRIVLARVSSESSPAPADGMKRYPQLASPKKFTVKANEWVRETEQ